mmetsp:Transcript_8669/g.29757  ORF Transcript_8669/g.29757 Transcript_8669/m.29757 type:complete len:230 (-) Transcript_8669:947-1636(-)
MSSCGVTGQGDHHTTTKGLEYSLQARQEPPESPVDLPVQRPRGNPLAVQRELEPVRKRLYGKGGDILVRNDVAVCCGPILHRVKHGCPVVEDGVHRVSGSRSKALSLSLSLTYVLQPPVPSRGDHGQRPRGRVLRWRDPVPHAHARNVREDEELEFFLVEHPPGGRWILQGPALGGGDPANEPQAEPAASFPLGDLPARDVGHPGVRRPPRQHLVHSPQREPRLTQESQ